MLGFAERLLFFLSGVVTLLFVAAFCELLIVYFFCLVITDHLLSGKFLRRKHHVLKLNLLGNFELVGMRIVIGFSCFFVNLDLRQKCAGLKHGLAHFPLLLVLTGEPLDLKFRHKCRCGNGIAHLLQHPILANLLLERHLAHTAAASKCLETRQRKFAVVFKYFDIGNVVAQLLVGHH